jgi:hypothetical protein
MVVLSEPACLKATTKPTTARPTYVLTLQAAPGYDDIRSLRALLKTAGRRYGLRALSVRKLSPPLRNIRPNKSATRRLSAR